MDEPRRSEPADFEIFVVVIGLCALLLGWVAPIWQPMLPSVCPMREIAGIPCPTCGGTRAWLAVARGDWGSALAFNPLIGLGGIALVLYTPWAAGAVAGGWRRPRFRLGNGWWTRGALLACLLANWIWVGLRF